MTKENEEYCGMTFMKQFMLENMNWGGLSEQTSDQIKTLWDLYKLPIVENDCSIISCEVGRLGSVVIRDVELTMEREVLTYKPRSYDFISIKSNLTRRILWTDYQNIEPYNRQGGLYCDGASFEMLGVPVVETPEYREFVSEGKYVSNISFAVWGFSYNDYYGSVTFGLCIKKDLVDDFLSKLRKILNK